MTEFKEGYKYMTHEGVADLIITNNAAWPFICNANTYQSDGRFSTLYNTAMDLRELTEEELKANYLPADYYSMLLVPTNEFTPPSEPVYEHKIVSTYTPAAVLDKTLDSMIEENPLGLSAAIEETLVKGVSGVKVEHVSPEAFYGLNNSTSTIIMDKLAKINHILQSCTYQEKKAVLAFVTNYYNL